MPQYVALLRGINVGGHRVKMDRLRSLFEDLGFQDVSTFIASGNVIFLTESADVDALTDRIERQLERGLGYEVAVFLRTPAQLAAIAAVEPREGGAGEGSPISHYVMFLRAPASASLRSALAGLESDMDEFRFTGAEVHWRIDGKLTDSPLFGGELDRATRETTMTMRNMNTVRRIVAKTGADPT